MSDARGNSWSIAVVGRDGFHPSLDDLADDLDLAWAGDAFQERPPHADGADQHDHGRDEAGRERESPIVVTTETEGYRHEEEEQAHQPEEHRQV